MTVRLSPVERLLKHVDTACRDMTATECMEFEGRVIAALRNRVSAKWWARFPEALRLSTPSSSESCS